jgi:hypothetical protein
MCGNKEMSVMERFVLATNKVSTLTPLTVVPTV